MDDAKRCAVCAVAMHRHKAATGSFTAAQAAAMVEGMAAKAVRCDACGIEFCLRCSVRAATSRGQNDYVCPRCGRRVVPDLI